MKMLKKSIVSLIAAAAVTTVIAMPASAAKMTKSLERDLVSICEAIQTDNKLKLHTRMKRARLDYQQISDGLVCNGMSVHEFAQLHNADQTGDLIAKRTRISRNALTAQKSF